MLRTPTRAHKSHLPHTIACCTHEPYDAHKSSLPHRDAAHADTRTFRGCGCAVCESVGAQIKGTVTVLSVHIFLSVSINRRATVSPLLETNRCSVVLTACL